MNHHLMKFARNDPCFCGSGRKYKHCHLKLSQAEPLTPWSQGEILNKRYSAEYCLHPDAEASECSGPIVRAHTIQRNGGLSKIASPQGYVYTFLLDGVDYAKARIEGTKILLERLPKWIGIRKASTFTGFCNRHDTEVFRPIEVNPFEECQEHAFLLAYRGICRSVFMKKANLEFYKTMDFLDRGLPLADQLNVAQIRRSLVDEAQSFTDMALLHKGAYDEVLRFGNYESVRYFIVRIKEAPEILCSGAITPHFDFQGRIIQDINLPRVQQEQVSFSIISTDSGGAVVFSWLKGNLPADRLVRSLKELLLHEVPHAIVRFTFEHFENVFVQPSWWEGLGKLEQERLKQRSMVVAQHQLGLLDDGLRVIKWNIASQEEEL